jgi:hypothetical protein
MRMTKPYVIIILAIFGCNQSSSTKNITQDRIPEPDLIERLEGQKMNIDSTRMSKNLFAKVYAKTPGSPQPIQVVDLQWPEDIEEVYNIWYNLDSQIVCIGAYPFSLSGDWDIGLTHYFENDGSTFAFERNTSFYNSMCTDDLAIEQIVLYYHNTSIVDSVYYLSDINGNSLVNDSCEFPYNYPYHAYPNTNDLLKSLGFSGR